MSQTRKNTLKSKLLINKRINCQTLMPNKLKLSALVKEISVHRVIVSAITMVKTVIQRFASAPTAKTMEIIRRL